MLVDGNAFSRVVTWVHSAAQMKSEGDLIISFGSDGRGSVSSNTPSAFSSATFDIVDDVPDKDLALVVPAAKLNDIARVISTRKAKKLNINCNEEGALVLRAEGMRFEVLSKASDPMPNPKCDDIAKAGHEDFFSAMQLVSSLPEKTGGMSVAMGSVDIHFVDDTLTLFGTNGATLGVYKVDAELLADKFEDHILLPVSVVNADKPSTSDGSVRLVSGPGGRFGYKFEDGRMVLFSTLDSMPVNYTPVLKAFSGKAVYSVSVKSSELLTAIRDVTKVSSDKQIRLSFSANKKSLGVSSTVGGSMGGTALRVKSSPISKTPSDIDVVVDAASAIRVLRATGSDSISVSFGGESDPLILRPLHGSVVDEDVTTILSVIKQK